MFWSFFRNVAVSFASDWCFVFYCLADFMLQPWYKLCLQKESVVCLDLWMRDIFCHLMECVSPLTIHAVRGWLGDKCRESGGLLSLSFSSEEFASHVNKLGRNLRHQRPRIPKNRTCVFLCRPPIGCIPRCTCRSRRHRKFRLQLRPGCWPGSGKGHKKQLKREKQRFYKSWCGHILQRSVGRATVSLLLVFMQTGLEIDDLRKSRGLHSVSAYRHGLYIYIYRSMLAGVAQSRHAFVGGTASTWAWRWRIPVNKGREGIRNADQTLTVRGEHADRIVGSPSC